MLSLFSSLIFQEFLNRHITYLSLQEMHGHCTTSFPTALGVAEQLQGRVAAQLPALRCKPFSRKQTGETHGPSVLLFLKQKFTILK